MDLTTRWMGPDEFDYRLGLCEGYLGHDEAALAAWGRLPPKSTFAEAAALNSAAVEMNRGHSSAAEMILQAARRPGRQVVTVGQVLARLLWEQGRSHDRRAVIESGWRFASQPGWPRPEEALQLLRDHMGVDFESLAVDAFRTLLDRAGEQAPDDDRVWLAWANLAIRTGQFDNARRRIDDCLRRRSEDPSVWRAELDWGMGTADVAAVRRALGHLPAEWFSTSEVERLRAWLAARRGDTETERRALERLVEDEPGHCPAWARLAVIATQAGRVEQARQLRQRKAAMDHATQRYVDLYNINRFAADAPELARLAETLGRRFEATGFLKWIVNRDPDDRSARTALVRLQGEETRRRALTQPLAQLLAAELAPETGLLSAGDEPVGGTTPQFRDDAQAGGLSFVYENGESSIHQLPEFAGGGVGLIDYDHDGWLDVFLVQGGRFPPIPLNRQGETGCFATAATGHSKM